MQLGVRFTYCLLGSKDSLPKRFGRKWPGMLRPQLAALALFLFSVAFGHASSFSGR
jgi:hypothetical protein